MWSGGIGPMAPTAAASDPTALARAERGAARANSAVASGQTEVRNAQDSVRSVEDGARQSANSYSGERIKLDPIKQQVIGLFNMARFREWMFARDERSKREIAILQRDGEDQNFDEAFLSSFFRICSRMSAAITGSTSKASGELYLKEYFRPDAPSQNQAPAAFAEAKSQADNLSSQEDALAKNEAKDRAFYTQRVDEEKDKLARKQGELAKAKVELAQAEQAEKAASKQS